MYIFSTLPQRGFGHHPPTVSAAPGTKVGPGKVDSVALHRRPGNTKNDRPTAPVVPFVVLWFCFPLRFTGTTTPSHLSIAPTKFAPSFLSSSFSKLIPPHPHSFTHFAGFRHSFFSPTAYICNFSLTRNQIHSRRLDISSPSAISRHSQQHQAHSVGLLFQQGRRPSNRPILSRHPLPRCITKDSSRSWSSGCRLSPSLRLRSLTPDSLPTRASQSSRDRTLATPQ